MNFSKTLILAIFSVLASVSESSRIHNIKRDDSNGCISFSVSQGTGCAWMCSYCANQLGTNNYYFTDSVCTYQTGGCVGNPIAGKTYTCCSGVSSAEYQGSPNPSF
jgi:hypothetical protein